MRLTPDYASFTVRGPRNAKGSTSPARGIRSTTLTKRKDESLWDAYSTAHQRSPQM
jgi:hypothetical protein